MAIKTSVDGSTFPLDDANVDTVVPDVLNQASDPNNPLGAISQLAHDAFTSPANTETDLSHLLGGSIDELRATLPDLGNHLGGSTPAYDASGQLLGTFIDDLGEGPRDLGNHLGGSTPAYDASGQLLGTFIDDLCEGPRDLGNQVSSTPSTLTQDAFTGQANSENQPSHLLCGLIDDLGATFGKISNQVGSAPDTSIYAGSAPDTPIHDVLANLSENGLSGLINTFIDDLAKTSPNLEHDPWQLINTFNNDLNLLAGDHNSGQVGSAPLDKLGTNDFGDPHLSGISPLHEWG